MKVLVIPDVHLKPYMFHQADRLLEQGVAERTVCLMDIPDDWDREYNIELYVETFDTAIAFAKKYPDTLWTYGNHDLCYMWNERRVVTALRHHGGVLDFFVKNTVPSARYHDVDEVVNRINDLHHDSMWNDASPIWYRPQFSAGRMYKPRKILQVVGHTPVDEIYRKDNVISCDVFSTYRDGRPIGTREFLLIDTKTWKFRGISG